MSRFLLIGVIFIYSIVILYSQDLQKPNKIAIRDCPVGTTTVAYECDTTLYIKNISHKTIELLDVNIRPRGSWDRYSTGNTFGVTALVSLNASSPIKLLSGDSVLVTVISRALQTDSIDTNNIYKEIINITYAFEKDTNYLKDSILLERKVIQSNHAMMTAHQPLGVVFECPVYDTTQNNKNPYPSYIYVYNTSNSDVQIDSIHWESDFNTFSYSGVSDEVNSSSILKLPYKIKSDRYCWIVFRNNLNTPTISTCRAIIYCHSISNDSAFVLHDSVKAYRKNKEEGNWQITNHTTNGYIGDSSQIHDYIFLKSCSGREFQLDSITTLNWIPGEIVVTLDKSIQYPLTIDPEFTYTFSVSYKPINNNKTRGFIAMHFSSTDTSYIRYIRYTTFPSFRSTSVYDDYIKSNVSVFPNPANDFIVLKDVQGNLISSVKIYDVVGRLLLEQTINADTGIIQLEKLPVGTHMAIIHRNDNTIVQIPCVIMR